MSGPEDSGNNTRQIAEQAANSTLSNEIVLGVIFLLLSHLATR